MDDEMVLFILIIISISIFILLVVFAIFAVVSEDKITTDYEFFDSSKFKTGDLIFVRYNNINGKVIKSLTSCNWHHVGIIYRDKITKELFVLEGAVYRFIKYDGFFKIKLDTWLRINARCNMCYMPLLGNKLDEDKLYSTYEHLILNASVRGFSFSWQRFLFVKKYFDMSKYLLQDFTCVEGAIYALQNCGVFSKKLACSSYYIQNILRREISTENGFKYGRPIELLNVKNPKYYLQN